MTRDRGSIGQGLAAARPPRPIDRGERTHVVGVAGAGASAAALLAEAAGGDVSGCDPGAPTPYTSALQARGIPIAQAHDAAHIDPGLAGPPARLAVTKALTSVDPEHPELVAARDAGIPVEAWQQVVADAAVSQGGRLVAIAGTHGKSTSAGWLVHLLVEAGRDPGAFVGALLPPALTGSEPATARWGRGGTFVVEADEYAGNFDPYRPSLAVVLNAEWDHPDVFSDRDAVVDALETWLRAADDGELEVVVNVGDLGGRELAGRLADWKGRRLTVAPLSAPDVDADVRWAREEFDLRVGGLPSGPQDLIEVDVRLAGDHNAANAACVAAGAASLGLSVREIEAGLGSFDGVGRRLDVKGEPRGVLVIDDYGHHPTAIRATLDAVRGRYPGRRVWIAHEPLTYHRAAAMLEELAEALAAADRVVIADIWVGRDPDTSITSAAALAAAVSRLRDDDVAAPGSVEATADYLAERVEPGDIVLAMGGGRSYVIADRLVALLSGGNAE